MKQKIWLILLILILAVPVCVSAEEVNGYIRLRMYGVDGAVTGGTVTLYEIGEMPDSMNAEELAEYAVRHQISGWTKSVDERGEVLFSDVKPGQYLLVQREPGTNYLPMKPFCISLPMTVAGKLEYEIDAHPKLEPEKKLPQTGLLTWPAWVLMSAGAVLVSIGCFGRKGH